MLGSMSGYDTIVLGAGAAGLMCALTAGARGRRVLVLERSNKPGKKILMSGGGRCNFTNRHCAPDRFLSANPHFSKSALSRYTQWDFIELVERHRIEYFEKETVNGLSGQLFCRQSSKQIVALLLAERCSTVALPELPAAFQLAIRAVAITFVPSAASTSTIALPA